VARPHPALRDLAAGRTPAGIGAVDDGLFASAVDHGMHGLLWSWVRDHEPRYPERARLAGLDAATRQRHQRLGEAFACVASMLADIDIAVAMLKGVAAEARWYGRVGERPCADVDVLVEPAASMRASDIVAALDPHHPLQREMTDLVRDGVMQSVNLWVDDLPIDVHFDPLKLGFPIRERERLWERMACVVLADGSTVRAPDDEISLVHFLVHANKDSFPRLLGYADVARVLASDRLDWSFIERWLRTEGLETIIACSLSTVTEALGLPTTTLPANSGFRAFAWRAAWPESVTLLGSAGTARSRRQELLPFLVGGRFVDAVRGAWRVAFPRASTVARRYPHRRGPYLWVLGRGRVGTWRDRRAALRVRRVRLPHPLPTTRDPSVTARLLRERARSEPLWLDVSGRSMGRSIPDGTRVRVEAAASPRRGEVWAWCNEAGEIVVHRSRGVGTRGHRFQGDAVVRADPPVADARLIGRVVELAPGRARVRWGPVAGAVQRIPRVAVARTVRRTRSFRRARAGTRR
jgi:hypothetical protein